MNIGWLYRLETLIETKSLTTQATPLKGEQLVAESAAYPHPHPPLPIALTRPQQHAINRSFVMVSNTTFPGHLGAAHRRQRSLSRHPANT